MPAARYLHQVQSLRADNWHSPYYGLSPATTVPVSGGIVPTGAARQPLLDRKRELERELLSVDALLNAGVRINRLPDELLAAIFEALRMSSPQGPSLGWLVCLHVCRHWFAVGATTPRLWSFVWVATSLNYARTCLARSKGVDIDISVAQIPAIVVPVLHLIRPHISRIRQLVFMVVARTDGPHLRAFMQTPMPALEMFNATVAKTVFDPSEEVITFPAEHFPRLVNISVGGIHLLPTPAFRQLKVLHIRGWLGLVPGLTTGLLTDILAELSSVEELYIADALCHDEIVEPAHPSRAIRTNLPNLRMLTLDSTTSEVVKHILSVISVPITATVVIHRRIVIEDEAMEAAILQGSRVALPEDRSGLPMLSRGTEARVLLWPDDTAVEVTMPTPSGELGLTRVSITIPRDYEGEAHPLLDDFFDICRNAPLEVLLVEAPPSWFSRINWREVFARFPKVHSLTVTSEDSEEGAKSLFDALDPDNAPADTPEAERVPLPALRKLILEGSSVREEALLPTVVGCLEHRRQALGTARGLEDLYLELTGHRGLDYFAEQSALYTEALSEYVETFTYAPIRDDVLADAVE